MGSEKAPAGGSIAAGTDQLERQIPKGVRQVIAAWDFTRRQLSALGHLAQFLLYGGGKGGGKTVFLCRWSVLECAIYPGNVIFLGRKRAVDFKNTTLKTFLRFIHPSLFVHHKAEQYFALPWCNGRIDYGGLDDPDVTNKFNSYECGGAGIDQAEEVDQEQIANIVGTLRLVLPGGGFPSYKIRMTANPAECFLKEDFIENPKEGNAETGKGQHAFIKALYSDNPFLPPDYIPNLQYSLRHNPQLLKAYIQGLWDNISAIDLLVQPSWTSKAKHLKQAGHVRRRIVVCDPAREGDDENVTFVMELADKVRIVHRFIEGHTKNTIATARRLVKTRRDWGATLIVVDAVGIGAGICDWIAEQKQPDKDELEPIFRYKGGEYDDLPDPIKKEFVNRKSWAWHKASDMFRDGLCIIPGDMPQLAGQLQWQRSIIVNDFKKRVLTKKELKTKRKKSPDQAETYVMGLHGLELTTDLPDDRPINPGTEFWERVKKDQHQIEHPDGSGEGEWQDVEI